jgi:hypothetical protein
MLSLPGVTLARQENGTSRDIFFERFPVSNGSTITWNPEVFDWLGELLSW